MMNKMKTRFWYSCLAMGLFMLSGGVLAGGATKGPHGGHVMTQNGCHYEVVVNEKERKVEVYASRVPPPVPSQLTLQAKKGNEVVGRVTLELMDSRRDVHRYQGKLSWDQQSSAGIQFRIELGSATRKSN